MFKYLLLCTLITHCIWAKPVHQHDLASHVVIVTPQAQVHLEPASKYAGATFLHHLSPLARIAAPHDETIVYVPASAAAPIIPIEALTHHIGRSSGGGAELTLTPIPAASQLKQNDQIQTIQQAFEQAQSAATNAQTAAQEGFGQISEQFSEAAASFSPAAFFPPPPGSSSGGSSAQQKDEKLKERIETPANTQPLLAATGRHFYAFSAPAIPHIVDFVHGAPVLVSGVSAIRARSLEDASQVPIVEIPLIPEIKPDPLPLKTDLKNDELKKEQLQSGLLNAEGQEKATDIGRFLEANALKDDLKQEKLDSLPLNQDAQQPGPAALNLNKIAENQTELKQPLLKSIVDGGVVDVVAIPKSVESVNSKAVDPVVDDFVVAKVV